MICNLCKILNNPLKRQLVRRVYATRDGANVGLLADEMGARGLVLSGVSQYLRQIEDTGIVRRSRSGRFVNYLPDPSQAPTDVRQVLEAFLKRTEKGDDAPLDDVFAALMNPFRARVVAMLAKAGSMSAVDICERTGHVLQYLKRDLKPAERAGLVVPDDTVAALAVYRYLRPADPFVELLVSFC